MTANKQDRADTEGRGVQNRGVQAALPHGTLSVGEDPSGERRTPVVVTVPSEREPASMQRDERGEVCEPMC